METKLQTIRFHKMLIANESADPRCYHNQYVRSPWREANAINIYFLYINVQFISGLYLMA